MKFSPNLALRAIYVIIDTAICRFGSGRVDRVDIMSKQQIVLEPSAIFARNIDWNLFKVFYEIARRGSITGAAHALNRTQPSISAALQRLEGHVGSPLCARTSRGVMLTIHGEHLFSACEGIYEVVQSMSRDASMLRGDVSGVVTLRVIASLYLQPRLTEMIERFHSLYPRIEIKLDVAPWREILRSLQSGEVELAIGFDPKPGNSETHILLSEQTQQLYCGPVHPLFGTRVASPSDLRDEPPMTNPRLMLNSGRNTASAMRVAATPTGCMSVCG
jgi:DNA-binding transcriptional LysR family regulator